MNITQIRASIFYPQTIGFTPDNFTKCKDLFLPDVDASVSPVPNMPLGNLSLGMPWQMSGKDEAGNILTVSFLFNKIDIVQIPVQQSGSVELDFVRFCSERFRGFLDEMKMPATRLAYCPLVSLADNNPVGRLSSWQKVLTQVSIEGIPCQDINMSFLIKKTKSVGEKQVDVNFLFNMMDGIRMKDGKKISDCVLAQLDINTVPEANYVFDAQEIENFLSNAALWKDEMIKNILL